jgi:hypothetical protein
LGCSAEWVEAYSDLESSICDCVNMGTIAVHLDCAGHQLSPMLVDIKKRNYAKGFAE